MGSPPDDAVKLKDQGNTAFRNQEWDKALEFYTKAIEAYDAEPSFYTNRAQARSLLSCTNCLLTCAPDIYQARAVRIRYTRRRQGHPT